MIWKIVVAILIFRLIEMLVPVVGSFLWLYRKPVGIALGIITVIWIVLIAT